MRTVRLTTILAVVASVSACGDPVQPTNTARAAPGSVQAFTGTYLGSGLSVADSTSTAPSQDTESGARAPGYGGSGH